MAFLEWRKFHFFDLHPNVDDGKLSELFKENKITTTSSGNNHLVLSDSLGQIYLVSRSWHTSCFRAYEISVDFTQQMTSAPILVTIGQDEPGVNPLIKVWDTSRLDKNGSPYCYRITRALPGNRPVQVSALCVHDNLQLMAVGFIDGSLIIYRGDVTRDRSSKQKVLRTSNSFITGLAFKSTASNVFLFVATEALVVVYNVTQKDKEQKYHLDNIGCAKKCCVLAESMQESHFMIGRDDAVYCYTSDGRGPCYAVDGEKIALEWFRSYLIIISKSTRSTNLTAMPASNENSINQSVVNETNSITVLDIHNKFIVFSTTMPKIKAILNEWGALYILDEANRVYHLDENDLQSKLSLLFKKNLYDIAIRIAKSHQYDSDGLVNIFKQYGDHLCDKSDFSGAIEQYIKTIGKLEPSYVIRKFLDSQHIEKLTMYLQALHKRGQATEDHTTLLLNCYTKLNNSLGQSDNLKEFILSKDGDFSYDIDVAIKVCRQGSPAEALMLSKKHEKHDWYIKIQLEDHRRYAEVLDYIANLKFEEAEHYMRKFGTVLVENAPHESTRLLKKLCTDYKPAGAECGPLTGNFDVTVRADPEEFIHLFLSNSERLIEFLEHLMGEGSVLSRPVYNTLLEHYLHVWSNSENVSDKNKLSQKILKLMQNPDVDYDKSQALVVCHMNSFKDGICILVFNGRFGHQEPTLWVQALWSCVRNKTNPSMDLLNEILTVIAKEKLFSPQLVVDAIGTGNANVTLGHIRSYITNELQQERKKTKEIAELTANYRRDTDKLKELLGKLKEDVVEIRGSRCAACHHTLELPKIHFLCEHSFHQHCFQSFSDDENECPTCQPENKDLLELLKAREHNKDLHETFHSHLEKAPDGFSVVAEYLSRGVFNRYKIIADEALQKTLEMAPERNNNVKREPATELATYGAGAEARLRQSEVKSKPRAAPVSEGRMRTQEHRYSHSLEANMEYWKPKSVAKSAVKSNPFQGGGVSCTNPFGEEDYDEAKNPFNDGEDEDEDSDRNNPFREDLRPF
ncbi:unnamed protein product [Phyllotreta striolata]|uniref:Vacuolar protein sorting-associated protein 11 homolog n=1 Tax=Phyllotreta striolata TaxID=444603 RepID=A0A9N9XN56_PHYSR|nr:unnamed protein product [Phyllotreta striolata]